MAALFGASRFDTGVQLVEAKLRGPPPDVGAPPLSDAMRYGVDMEPSHAAVATAALLGTAVEVAPFCELSMVCSERWPLCAMSPDALLVDRCGAVVPLELKASLHRCPTEDSVYASFILQVSGVEWGGVG